MICMLRTLGAPVTEPLGNSARKTSTQAGARRAAPR